MSTYQIWKHHWIEDAWNFFILSFLPFVSRLTTIKNTDTVSQKKKKKKKKKKNETIKKTNPSKRQTQINEIKWKEKEKTEKQHEER